MYIADRRFVCLRSDRRSYSNTCRQRLKSSTAALPSHPASCRPDCMSSICQPFAALRAVRSMQLLLSRTAPLPGAHACGARQMQLRALSADAAASELKREDVPGSDTSITRTAKAFAQASLHACVTQHDAHARRWRMPIPLLFNTRRTGSRATAGWSRAACSRRWRSSYSAPLICH